MKNKLKMVLAAMAALLPGTYAAAVTPPPTITIVFTDPQGLCRNHSGQTQFAFNYQYTATGGIEYYSGPVNITRVPAIIAVPPPKGEEYRYQDFEITDQGDCGQRELDYQDRGNCFLTNLIPPEDQQTNDSYKITLTPQDKGISPYGTPMYNLTCRVNGAT